MRLAKGERRFALEAFAEAVESGWHLLEDLYQVSDALAGESEFEAAMEVIEAEMSRQQK